MPAAANSLQYVQQPITSFCLYQLTPDWWLPIRRELLGLQRFIRTRARKRMIDGMNLNTSSCWSTKLRHRSRQMSLDRRFFDVLLWCGSHLARHPPFSHVRDVRWSFITICLYWYTLWLWCPVTVHWRSSGWRRREDKERRPIAARTFFTVINSLSSGGTNTERSRVVHWSRGARDHFEVDFLILSWEETRAGHGF